MSESVTIAVLSLLGTLLGSIAGILASGKLTSFRLENLEKKMDEYGKLILKIPMIEKQQQSTELRLSTLENNSRIINISS